MRVYVSACEFVRVRASERARVRACVRAQAGAGGRAGANPRIGLHGAYRVCSLALLLSYPLARPLASYEEEDTCDC